MKSRVSVLRVRPDDVLASIERLCELEDANAPAFLVEFARRLADDASGALGYRWTAWGRGLS